MFVDELPFVMIRCLIITIIIELIVGLLIGVRGKKDLLNIILVNILTNPLVVSLPILMLLLYGEEIRYITLAILEIIAVLVEGFIYLKVFKYKRLNGLLVSLILNLSSYLFGELINSIIFS